MIGACLDKSSIAHMLEANPPLIEGYPDLTAQLQPNGFDLTLAEVAAFGERYPQIVMRSAKGVGQRLAFAVELRRRLVF
ncbi:MAG: hypothetical protein IIC27_00295 [Chloroflexi bacterium]|nr:hypothetical protein [Chloroflexota bacterium]